MPYPPVGAPQPHGYPYLGQPAPTWVPIARIDPPGAWRTPLYLGPDIFGCGASRLGHNFVAYAQQEGYEREAVGAMHYGSNRWPLTGFIPQDEISELARASDHDVLAARHFLDTVRTDWQPVAEALHDLYPVLGVDIAHLESPNSHRLMRLVQCQFQQLALTWQLFHVVIHDSALMGDHADAWLDGWIWPRLPHILAQWSRYSPPSC